MGWVGPCLAELELGTQRALADVLARVALDNRQRQRQRALRGGRALDEPEAAGREAELQGAGLACTQLDRGALRLQCTQDAGDRRALRVLDARTRRHGAGALG